MYQLPESPNSREITVAPVSYAEGSSAAPAEPGMEQSRQVPIEFWRILRRRKGTLILVASVGMLAGLLVTIPQTPIYQARLSLEIVGFNQNFLNVRESSPLNETGTSSDVVDIQTQVKILESDSLMDRVFEKLKSAPHDSLHEDRISAWRKVLNLPEPASSDAREQALLYARRSLKVRSAALTRIVELTVDSINPHIAADFANTLANEFIDQSLESRWKATMRTGEWLAKQLDDMRVRLERSEDRLQEYARKAGLVFADNEKTNVSEQRLLQVQQALSVAQADRISKQSRWEMASSSPTEALPDVLNDLTLREYQAKLTELTRQLAELRTTFTSEHAKVKRVQAQIVPLQAALERERSNILKRIRNEYEEAVRREKLLTSDYVTQRGVVSGEGAKSIQYNILKREVDSNRQLYDAMLQQLKQATLASALRASNIRVVDAAKVPKRPYKPDLLMNAVLGLFAGLFLGVAFVVALERSDRAIQNPGETAFYLNAPELGIIPSESRGKIRIRIVGSKGQGRLPQPRVPALQERVELVTWQNKPSIMAESFRATLISILFSSENGNRPRVMVVTSANVGEGKSTIVSNLGIAVAEVNQKVLLIDADLRKPRLHEIFGLRNDRGLSDLLRSKDSVVHDGIIRKTSLPNLHVLPSGPTTSAATSLLYSNRMSELLRILEDEFETIFLDTPPMLHIPDARVLGRVADCVILVVQAGQTTRDVALAAYQRFAEDSTKVLGTILNRWDPKRSANRYYGYYDGYYKRYYHGGRDGSE